MKTNFLECVKLYLFISEKWEGKTPSFHFQCTPNNCLEIVKKNCRDKWQSTKSILNGCYISRKTTTSLDKQPFI